MVETRDILLKAAEDVQSGMWCSGAWFADEEGEPITDDSGFFRLLRTDNDFGIDEALQSKRCAEGSLALATALLGGDEQLYRSAKSAVTDRLWQQGLVESLQTYNDVHLPDDPFEAGQTLAELFRTTAESL